MSQDAFLADPLRSVPAGAPRPLAARPRPTEHFVRFYEEDDALLVSVADFLGNGLHAGGAAVLVATEPHREDVRDRLARAGHDLAALAERGRLVVLDARETMERLLVAGSPDADRFEEVVGGLLRKATAAAVHPRVWVFGEVVALLWAEGRAEAALRLERLWNELSARLPMSLFCAYPTTAFAGDPDGRSFAEMCAEHGRVVPSESWTDLDASERDRTVSDLQRRALALDREVARRRALEDALRRRDKELGEMLDATRDGVVDLDPDGRVRWGNRSFLDLVGRDGPFGGPVGDVLLEDPSVFADVLGRLLRGEPLEPRPVALRTRDGGRTVARLHAAALRTEGRALHVRWFLRAGAA